MSAFDPSAASGGPSAQASLSEMPFGGRQAFLLVCLYRWQKALPEIDIPIDCSPIPLQPYERLSPHPQDPPLVTFAIWMLALPAI
jgi:hypothetical protein